MSSSREKHSFVDVPLGRVAITRNIKEFMTQHPERQLSSEQIKTVLAMYKQWRDLGRRGINTKFLHSLEVMFYIADRMFWSNFPDSENVVELLDLIIMDLDKHLFLIMCPRAGEFAYFSNADVGHLVYFLNHAYKQKHLFDGYRMPFLLVFDTFLYLHPVAKAVRRKDILLLHLLLRYGALLSYDKDYNDPTIRRFGYLNCSFAVLISNVELIVKRNPRLLTIGTLTLSPEEYHKYSTLVSCCSLLLKDVPQWPLTYLNYMSFPCGSPWKKDYSAFIREFSRNVVSGFQQHFNTPMDLKEICRRVIRTNLNENWQLPHGIPQLPLPKPLQLYLDLCD